MKDRVPPQDMQAEACVLGGMMLEATAVATARSILTPSDFYRPAHGMIFQGLLDMQDAREPVDLVTSRAHFIATNQIDAIGGQDYLADLGMGVPDAANTKHYAEIVRDMAIKRSLITLAGEMSAESYATSDAAESLLSRYQQSLFDLDHRCRANTGNESTLPDAARKVLTEAESVEAGQVKSWKTGYQSIDDAIHGLRPGHLITLGAATGAGKTTFALNVAANVANNRGCVLYVSAEMLPEELAQRVLQAQANVWGSLIQTGRLRVEDWTRLNEAEAVLGRYNAYLVGRALSLGEIALKIRETANRFETAVNLVVVDYLQIMRLPAARDLRERVGLFTSGLKQLAMECKVPIIALSQFSRDPIKAGKPPTMHDLKESGSIENDSNAVILLYKPTPEIRPFDDQNRQYTEVWAQVAKCRDGLTNSWPSGQSGDVDDSIRLRWYPGITKFEE